MASCADLGLPTPPTVAAPAGAGPAVDLAEPAGAGGLRERLLHALALPEVVVHAHVQERIGPLAHLVVLGTSGGVVEQRSLGSGIEALRYLPGATAPARVEAFTGLDRTVAAEGSEVRVTGRAWISLQAWAPTRPDAARRLLHSEGVARPAADALVAALGDWVRRASVVAVRDAGPRRLVGTATAWLDAGAGGVWEVVAPRLGLPGAPSDDREALLDVAEVVVRPSSARALLEEVEMGVNG